MSEDEFESEEEQSDIRRRAAWLLAMLAVVAGLFVLLMVTFLRSSGGGHKGTVADIGGPTDQPQPTSQASTPHPGGSSTTRPGNSSSGPSGPSGSGSSSSSATSTTHAPHQASCPTSQPCALDDDIGNAVAAINAYRTSHGKQSVPGAVSEAAKSCALHNGSGCSGGWAESQVPKPTGDAAVAKIRSLGKLLDPMKSFSVGWAYDPGSKQYYFAIIRKS